MWYLMSTANKSEKMVAGAGYVISFLNDIEMLTQNIGNYASNISRLKLKYGKLSNKTEWDEGDTAIINISEAAKMSSFQTYIKFTALKKKVKEFASLDKKEPTMKDLYEKIEKQALPNVEDFKAYLIRLHELFVESIDVFTTAQGIYSAYLSQGEQPNV